MKKTLFTIFVFVAIAGCSSSDDDASSTTGQKASCVSAGASYVVHSVERSGGTCGTLPDQVVNTSTTGAVTVPANCTGTNREDGCDVYADNLQCKTEGASSTTTGKTSWAADGSSAHGTLQINITLDDGTKCSSAYDVTYTKQ